MVQVFIEPDESGSSRDVDGRIRHVAEAPFEVVTTNAAEDLFGDRVQLLHEGGLEGR